MSDYNIHIHLPGNSQEPQRQVQESVADNIIRRVQKCIDWKSFYTLSKEFPKIGMAVTETADNKILCRLVDGKPLAESILDDYVFLGAKNNLDGEISQRHLELLTIFIRENHGHSQEVLDTEKSHNYSSTSPMMYGKPLFIYNEKTVKESQEMAAVARLLLS